MSDKLRLDAAVFKLGLAPSREKAQALIMAGQIYLNGQKMQKAGTAVKADDKLELRGNRLKYVSRGGLKLEKAIEVFSLSLDGLICMDVGASTGGFTDCMLQNGAARVYAVDVGYGQLDWKLRSNERVISLERTNFRYASRELIPEEIDFSSVDVSFISLKLIFPVLKNLLKPDGQAVCLIKPQFEAGRNKVGKKGVVREKNVHCEVIENVMQYIRQANLKLIDLDFSPVKGPEGNIEYLAYISSDKNSKAYDDFDIDELVERSHNILNGGEDI